MGANSILSRQTKPYIRQKYWLTPQNRTTPATSICKLRVHLQFLGQTVEQRFIHKPKSSHFISYFLSLLTVGVISLSLSLSTIRATNGSSLGVLIKVTAKQDQIKVEKDQIEAWFVVWVDLGLIFD
jgi:hypothetical protein